MKTSQANNWNRKSSDITQSCFNSNKLHSSRSKEVNTPCHWIPLWNLDSLKKHLVLLRGPTKNCNHCPKTSPPFTSLSTTAMAFICMQKTPSSSRDKCTGSPYPDLSPPSMITLHKNHSTLHHSERRTSSKCKTPPNKVKKNLFPASCPPYHSFHIFHSLHGFKSFYSFDSLQDFHGLQSI